MIVSDYIATNDPLSYVPLIFVRNGMLFLEKQRIYK